MHSSAEFSRRAFLGAAAAVPLAVRAAYKRIPVGLELYSVREALQKDTPATLEAVAKMGYQCVEFYAPYYAWTPAAAKKIRKQLDDLGVRCYSTHNDSDALKPAGLAKAIELNGILGTKYVVLAHPGDISTLDEWKGVADLLNAATRAMEPHGLRAGYHNHDLEWHPVEGRLPIEVIAGQTAPSVMLQLDVGTCLEAGHDPVAWIERNPGRIRSLHCKDWSKDMGYQAVFNEGSANWPRIFQAAENFGGVEYYLIEQEGSKYSELETAQRCLKNWHTLRG